MSQLLEEPVAPTKGKSRGPTCFVCQGSTFLGEHPHEVGPCEKCNRKMGCDEGLGGKIVCPGCVAS